MSTAVPTGLAIMSLITPFLSAEENLLSNPELRQELSQLGKIAAWGIIGGSTLTMYSMYKAREQAKKQSRTSVRLCHS